MEQSTEIKEGYLKDYISGQILKASPEEVEAVQVFSKQLVEDYGYPINNIQTRPQWRVKVRPSDTRKEYPVDIVVFPNERKVDGEEYIIVECKKKNRKDGRTQLEDYLRFSRASLGAWFNGEEKLYLKKTEKDGRILFEEIPNIPKFGQRIEDIGLFKRKDLKAAHNLKAVFKSIRNYLAANAVGVTRDEVFAQQIINLVFCKIYDERFTKLDDIIKFRAGIDESEEKVQERILGLFEHVKKQYSDVIEVGDTMILDAHSLTFVVGELQQYCLLDSERDAIADAFETFIGPSLKGGQGQFFTPRNVVKLITGIINPSPSDKLIDPACGSGGFLVESLRHVWRQVELEGKKYNWPESEVFAEKQKVAIQNFRGIDKDSFLSKVAKSYMAILGDGRGGVFCESSLDNPTHWSNKTKEGVQLNTFSVVVTNPPFGKKLKIADSQVLGQFNLGHKWQVTESKIEKTNKLVDSQSPQVLFIERCLELLKDGGFLGIIAPESMFSNPSHSFIVEYIKSQGCIRAVISMPEELFQPYTHAKTCVVIIEKGAKFSFDDNIFMGIAKWCGHDSRGLEVPYDDIPKVLERYVTYKKTGKLDYNHLGFIVKAKDIKNNIYLPKYYNPEINLQLEVLKKSHDLVTIGELKNKKLLDVRTGHEVGKLSYGTGNIPFIRSSDIANWEIKIDPKQGLSEEIFLSYEKKQDVRLNDILMVRDGTYLVGTSALITELDRKIVYQSHIFKIRSLDSDLLHPYLLLALLSTPLVKEQIYAKRFTQDIIDTLGNRLLEIVLPIPKDKRKIEEIIENVKKVMESKSIARNLTREIIQTTIPNANGDLSEFFTIGK